MEPRTIGAIALRPTGNKQGVYYFYSLLSGGKIHRTHWTDVPMPEDVKDRLHAMARRAKADQGLSFTDSAGTNLDDLYPDDDTDDEYDPDDDDDKQSCESNQSSDASCSKNIARRNGHT